MGADFNVYRGPTVRTDATYMRKDKVHTCPDTHCKSHMKHVQGSFCSDCGSKAVLLDIEIKTEVDLWDILDDLGDGDYLMQVPYNDGMYISNGEFGEYFYDEFTESLLSINPEEELKKFTQDPMMMGLFIYCIEHGITLSLDYEIVGYWS